jgi:hypothetical protein
METLKRKRGRPRKTENEFTPITNEIVIVQPKSVIKQKKLEDKIFEINEIIEEHKFRHKKEMEVFWGRVEKLKTKLENDHLKIIEHYEDQLGGLTTQIVKERTREYQHGMIFVKGDTIGIITNELQKSWYGEDYYFNYKKIITTGIGNKTGYFYLSNSSKIEVLCHISKFKQRCEEHGINPIFNKKTCVLLYERMYQRKFDEGEFQYSLLEKYGLVTR